MNPELRDRLGVFAFVIFLEFSLLEKQKRKEIKPLVLGNKPIQAVFLSLKFAKIERVKNNQPMGLSHYSPCYAR